MAPTLHFGLRIPSIQQVELESLRRFVLRAEELGFHSIWAGDHVFHPVDVLQPLHLLSWVSGITARVRLGTAILLAAYLDPVLLAKAAATMDYLSGGRLVLGLSIGGTDAEYASIGVPTHQRVGRLLENVAIMRELWRADDVAYQGRYHTIQGATIKPKPIQQPGIPLYFGATGRAMLHRAALHADGWVASSAMSTEAFRRGVALVRGAAAAGGRDPDSLCFAKLHGVSVHRDPTVARALAERQWKSYYGPRFDVEAATFYGTPEECAARLGELARTEAPELTLVLEPPTLALEELDLLHATTELVRAQQRPPA